MKLSQDHQVCNNAEALSALLQIWTDCLFLLQKALAYDIKNQIRVIYIGG